MRQQLQGVESGIEHDLCLRPLPPDGVGKAEEQGIATGEDDDIRDDRLVLFEDSIEWRCDVDPLGICRQQWGYDFMMALATREYLALLDDI